MTWIVLFIALLRSGSPDGVYIFLIGVPLSILIEFIWYVFEKQKRELQRINHEYSILMYNYYLYRRDQEGEDLWKDYKPTPTNDNSLTGDDEAIISGGL